ncbi:unnamed protein product [Acanthocheilonema viteae]|uniref:Uncharacterized protein n=1 Tax=Acanthocheilonema viteae TaxID=6277 RepID=A0A498SA13_ACAVI|nr:unnamed protein product [Acanthocheilonema viteae]
MATPVEQTPAQADQTYAAVATCPSIITTITPLHINHFDEIASARLEYVKYDQTDKWKERSTYIILFKALKFYAHEA